MSEESFYYIYILRCADNSLYTGITTDPARRFAEHASRGKKSAGYTYSHRAQTVAAVFKACNRREALSGEYRIKRLSKEQKEELVAESEAFTYEQLVFPRVEADGVGNLIAKNITKDTK